MSTTSTDSTWTSPTAANGSPAAASRLSAALRPLEAIGSRGRQYWRRLALLTATCGAVLVQAARPVHWRRTVRSAFARHCYDLGVRALPFVATTAVLIGIGAVFQALLWLGMTGQDEYIGQFLVIVIVREIAPLLIVFIILGRSGSAMVAHVSDMRRGNAWRLLEAQGVDPFVFTVMTRATAASVAAFGLTVFFLAVCLATGFLTAALLEVSSLTAMEFINRTLGAMGPQEYLLLLFKPTLGALAVSVVCCTVALEPDRREDPTSLLPVAFTQSLLVLLAWTGLVSLLLR